MTNNLLFIFYDEAEFNRFDKESFLAACPAASEDAVNFQIEDTVTLEQRRRINLEGIEKIIRKPASGWNTAIYVRRLTDIADTSADMLTFLKMLSAHNVRLVSVEDGIDTAALPENVSTIDVMARMCVFAETVRKKSREIARAVNNNRGWQTSGRPSKTDPLLLAEYIRRINAKEMTREEVAAELGITCDVLSDRIYYFNRKKRKESKQTETPDC